MATTTNFGWTTPDNTGYVKDGALAIRTLGNGIDTSLLDLKGGTTGQVLKKNSATDLDFVWGSPASQTNWTSIATATPSGGSSYTFSSLSGYNSFVIDAKLGYKASGDGAFYFRFNGDDGSNYFNSYLMKYGSSSFSSKATSASSVGYSIGGNVGDSGGQHFIRIKGGAGTGSKVWDTSGLGGAFSDLHMISSGSGIYTGTSGAITSITVLVLESTFSTSGNSITLYGSAT